MASRPRSAFERAEYAIIVSSLLLLTVITLQPLVHLLALSLSDPAQVPSMSGIEIWPKGFSLDVWHLLLGNSAVQRGVLNAVFITVAGTALNIVLTAMMAWALSRKGLPGRRFFFIAVLVTIVFDPGIIPDYFVNRRLGLINSYWSVLLYKAVNAWYLILLIRFFEEIPQELLEASELDGASVFQQFWYVVLPLTKPALATISLFYLVFHWNEFFRAMIYLTDQSKWPLQVVLRQFVIGGDRIAMVGAQNMANFEGAAQIAPRALNAGMIILAILPILIIYPLILKFFTKGTMSGALKG